MLLQDDFEAKNFNIALKRLEELRTKITDLRVDPPVARTTALSCISAELSTVRADLEAIRFEREALAAPVLSVAWLDLRSALSHSVHSTRLEPPATPWQQAAPSPTVC